MDDKPPELAALQEKVIKALETVSAVIAELAKQVQESNEREKANLQQQMARLNAVPTQPYLGGQFRRRDGDGFGIGALGQGQIKPPEPPDANHKAGDLRSPRVS